MDQRTLANIVNQDVNPSGGSGSGTESQTTNRSFNTYLTVFSIQLAHRFPDLSDLNNIEVNNIRRIADFSFGCSSVALNTWEQYDRSIPSSLKSQQMKRTA